ncbi:kinase-like domain-containing protein [Gigaspora rosea]|uniref:Kinase-like domain-containing protein n=1 Tax=Gigaspora rosea TaxID=44941 RepID=A0A397VYX1_9GLOM|nr:kinase-like domain-containing protein [Gigaspora rosea]
MWCLSCDPDKTTRWTSEKNKDIDECMKTFQLRAYSYEDVIEWIPYNQLSDITKIGKGGFGTVYSARWLDGIRKVERIDNKNNSNKTTWFDWIRKFVKFGNKNNSDMYKISREPSSIVALKTLASSKENNFDILKEFKSHMKCKLNYSKLAIYGITQNTETKEFMMVFQYANNGNLHNYLRKNFSVLTWQDKLQILNNISDELQNIHDYAGYIHADFHSGNILQDQQPYIQKTYIADLGLSRKKEENILEGDIYGVMPYVAPEVLSGEQKFTQAADIYGFGVIMVEMTSGQRPFDGCKFDTKLATKICKKGLRPECAPGTPQCYIELAKKCMHSEPQKRPRAVDISITIRDWLMNITSSNDNEIKKHFLDADKAINLLPISKNSDEMYTSKIISTKLISKAIKELS